MTGAGAVCFFIGGFFAREFQLQAAEKYTESRGGVRDFDEPGVGEFAFDVAVVAAVILGDHEFGVPDEVAPEGFVIIIDVPDFGLDDLKRVPAGTERPPH